jgi:hypothetical protein
MVLDTRDMRRRRADGGGDGSGRGKLARCLCLCVDNNQVVHATAPRFNRRLHITHCVLAHTT